MEVCTIGFAKKSASTFFSALRQGGISRLIDVRLNNTSQLAGFTKRDDLAYFLREICDVEYVYEPLLAPTASMLKAYRKRTIDWPHYEQLFLGLMDERRVAQQIPRSLFNIPSVLLCSEPTAVRCHRRLAVEYLARHWPGTEITHL